MNDDSFAEIIRSFSHNARKREKEETLRRPELKGPTNAEREKYPALDIAWKNLTDEYNVLYNITTGKKL